MAHSFPIKYGKLQSNLDADHFTILNLDLTGLGLNRASVGLPNVDNTSDVNKPVSILQSTAINLREPAITAGTTDQVWRGNKTWLDFGDLMLQDAETTLDHLSIIGLSASAGCFFRAKRNDFSTSFVATYVRQLGATATGTLIPTVNSANAGAIIFDATSVGLINTSTGVPIVFGTNNVERARILSGLSLGTTTDPGSGCIIASGTIAAAGNIVTSAGFVGTTGAFSGALTVATTAGITGNITGGGKLYLTGEGGTGFIEFAAQTSAPTSSLANFYADTAKKLSLVSGSSAFAIKFDNAALTAARAFAFPDAAGTVAIEVATPGSTAITGKAGTISYDSGFLYVCVATDTWKRAALSTF